MFLERAARRWWTLVVRGVFAIAFGILTFTVPTAAVLVMVLVFGVYSIAEGTIALGMLLRPSGEGSWLLGLGGVVSIVAGLLALLWPGITALALFYVIAGWAIALGVIELIGAIVYSHHLENEWSFVLSGLLWLAFGLVLVVWPRIGAVAVLTLIATASILRGVLLIVSGARLRNTLHHLPMRPTNLTR